MTQENEPEWRGPLWKHPYFLYAGITAVLFLFLLLMAGLAWNNDWLPRR